MATLGEYLGAGSGTTKLLLHLNGSSADSSGNGNNGTDTSVTYSQANGYLGQGAGFNGTSSQITTSVPINFNNDFTVNIRFNYSSEVSGWNWLLNFNDYGTSGSQAITIATNGTRIRCSYGTWFTQIPSDSGSQPVLASNTWHLLTFVRSGSNVITYHNGSQYGATTATTTSTIPTSGTMRLGRGPSTGDWYGGKIDEVIIENVAWSAEKIKQYYTFTKGRFGTI